MPLQSCALAFRKAKRSAPLADGALFALAHTISGCRPILLWTVSAPLRASHLKPRRELQWHRPAATTGMKGYVQSLLSG